jgi:MEMO1 family protein
MVRAARLFFILFFLGWGSAALAGTVRPAVWAGKFYPLAPDELKQTIAGLTAQASRTRRVSPPQGRLRALILPHAGYIYSGLTAAHAHQVLIGTAFSKVILMGPDHRVGFADAAISDVDAYATPLGTVPLHPDARRLRAEAALFRSIPESDRSEHCLEVVLPFLQTDLPAISLVPIVVGRCEPEAIGRAIVPLIDGQTLVVVSSDLSHYLPYEEAKARDQVTIQAILALDAGPLLSDENRSCGRYPLAVLLGLARRFQWRPALLNYTNSGDTAGDHQAVVGYAAIAFYGESDMPSNPSHLTPEQGQALLCLARDTLNTHFGRPAGAEASPGPRPSLDDPALQIRCGTFVTLKIGGNLRGCIGSLTGREPLVEGVRTHALNAAFHDPRFRPLTAAELERVAIEVSVLTEPRPLTYAGAEDLIAKLRPQVDGVTIRQGYASATFLPQVWDQLPKPETFLSQLCLKAGLAADAWRQGRLEVETYQVQYFEEPH